MSIAKNISFPEKYLSNEWLMKFLVYFSLIDITILPYFKYFIVPYSLPLIVVSSLIIILKSKKDYYYYLFIIILVSVIISLLASLIIFPYNQYATNNVKRACQLITTFAYFFSVKWISTKFNINYRLPLYLYILIIGVLAHLFILDPISTLEMMRNFYGPLVTEQEIVLVHYRFAYLFSDPNTSSYFFLIAVAPALIALKDRPTWFVILSALGMMIIFIGQSRGAMLIFPVILLFTYFYNAGNYSINYIFPRIAPFFLIIGSSIAIFLLYFYLNADSIVLKKAYIRLLSSDGSYANGGHRFSIWLQGIDYYLPLPFGRGYSLYMNNELYFPHSDVIGILYRYGFIALFAIIFFLFNRFSASFTLFLPGFMAFFINSLVDEQKVFSLFLMLLAFYLNEQKNKMTVSA
ncbi:O-antigen ligase family protein [Polynucleobacter sp. AM-7D1]|uniref:O-antigen ligase family protein n=1 Tax=Polynucleobacter sp. AM-7D1 TaxID=2689102 RepID=UPI001BFD4EBD|nr:O-antigen ligase family protein [Polynucleobacter sp. AM-7D1]QWE29003.1 hypothetical protein GQ359_01605 [Polynucleobacter sp. AM-7D1]